MTEAGGSTVGAAVGMSMEDEPHYSIAVQGDPEPSEACAAILRMAVEAALRRFEVRAAGVSLTLVDDARIAELNERYLAHMGPTDVITFDLRDDSRNGDTEQPEVEGEIVISTETAARESQARGHHADREMALYAVHGVLHLLGHDDAEEGDAARMHELEDDILVSIGLGPVYGESVRRR